MIIPGQHTTILMTADCLGGVWTYSLELAAAAAEHGCEFILVTMGREPTESQRRSAERLSNLRLISSEHGLEWMTDPSGQSAWEDIDAAGKWLLDLARQEQPDVVHLNHYSFASLDWQGIPVLLAAHSSICTWWHAVHGAPPPSTFDEYRRRVAAGLKAADLVVAPTRAMLDDLHALYGKLPATRVVHNGRSIRWDDAPPLLPRSKDPVILAAGRLWDEAKNIQLLNQAAPALPWPCLIAGDLAHPQGGEGKRLTVPNLVALGELSPTDMAAQLCRASIFAHPARYEPFGLAPLEAALAGCALVLGEIPALCELWEGAASFVDPEDPEALRLAIDELISRPARRARAAAAAWQRAAIYSPERFGASYAALYSELREKARRQHPSAAAAR